MKVGIIGLGYVGLPIAIKAVEVGHDVIGVDVGEARLDSLRNRRSYTEDVTDERLRAAWDTGRFAVQNTAAPIDADMILITVPTPVNGNKQPDLGYIETAAAYVARGLRRGQAVVLESTTYPGTTEDVVARVIRQECGLVPVDDYHLGYSPERINPGDKVNTFDKVPKIVSGVGPAALELIQAFYDTIVEQTVPVSSPRAAEMAKIFENTFANTNIALVNELALVCSDMGIDVDEVLDAAETKGHAIMRFKPGLGTGGHCLPVDPLYLAWMRRAQYGKAFKFAELADEINSYMPVHAVQRIRSILGEAGIDMWNSRILVLGSAYKPNVADTRESPSVVLHDLLRDTGAQVEVLDPHVLSPDDADTAVKTAGDYDIVVIATAHDEFDYAQIRTHARRIFDPRNVYAPGDKVSKL